MQLDVGWETGICRLPRVTVVTANSVRESEVMASRTVIELTDDFDGTPAAETLEFAFEGVAYAVDVSEENAAHFRELIGEYVQVARVVGDHRRTRSTKTISNRRDVHRVREWAAENGFQISSRGRIPRNVVEAYESAH